MELRVAVAHSLRQHGETTRLDGVDVDAKTVRHGCWVAVEGIFMFMSFEINALLLVEMVCVFCEIHVGIWRTYAECIIQTVSL